MAVRRAIIGFGSGGTMAPGLEAIPVPIVVVPIGATRCDWAIDRTD